MDSLVWWHVSGRDAYSKPVFLVPQNVSGWWEDAQEQFVDPQNVKQLSRAVVDIFGSGCSGFTPGDMIARGRVNTLPSGTSGSPETHSGAVVIRQVAPNRDFRRQEVSRTLYI